MPQVSTGPLVNKVSPVEASPYTFANDDTWASIQSSAAFPAAGVGGIILNLPGPTYGVPGAPPTGAPYPSYATVEQPSNGDFYKVADPSGVLSGAKIFTVWGGGFDLYDPVNEVLRKYLQCNLAFANFSFTFDDTAQIWIVCAGGPI